MNATIYANYGVLASEYRTVYTVNTPHCHAAASEKLIIELPDELKPYLSESGEIVLRIPGMPWPYMLGEVIGAMDGFPAICWYDGSKHHKIMLRVVSGAERLN